MLDNATQTATAEEPQEFYDTLSTTEQEVFDLVGSLGFRPEKNDEGWLGLSITGDDIIGPCESLSKLAEAVQGFVEKRADDFVEGEPSDDDEDAVEGEIEIAEDSRGRRFFPGMAPIVDPQIAAAAGKYHAIKTERVDLLAREKAAKEDLLAICKQKYELFTTDPDNTNSKIYRVGELVIRFRKEWTEKLTTEILKVEEV